MPGCHAPGPAAVWLRVTYGAAVQAEDGSWGEQPKFKFFEDDSKEETFKLYKSDQQYKKAGDVIATVSQDLQTWSRRRH
jgi:hypothetical protein